MIQENAILVTFSACQWVGRKLDRSATKEINDLKEAKDDAGRYNKLLVSKDKTKDISATIGKARTYHYDHTLYWSDNNERLLTTKMYFDYIAEMSKLKSEFENNVQLFIGHYANTIEQEKLRLGKLFNIMDYPPIEVLQKKFSFEFTFMPLPENNIKLALAGEEVSKIRQQVENEINTRIANSVNNIWERIKEVLSAMKEKLKDQDAIFRDSLFGNMQELIELIPALNVTNDPAITKIADSLKNIKTTPEEARNNSQIRKDTAAQVEDIMNQFNNFFK